MLKLFLTFLKIGLFTFGGGYAMIPLIEEELSNFAITTSEFSNFIAISEATPGPFAINIATFIGYNNYGLLGAIIATFAVCLPSLIIMLIIAIFINKVKEKRFFKTFIKFATPITLGLILSSTIKISSTNLFNLTSFSTIKEDFSINLITLISLSILAIVNITYFLIKKKRISPFLTIIIGLTIGIVYFFVKIYFF